MKAYRAEKISIDLPRSDTAAWVHSTLQIIELDQDGKVISVSGRQEEIFRKANEVALQTFQIKDAVTGQDINMSIYGLAEMLRIIMKKWIQEDFPNTTYDPANKRVMINAG